MENIDAKKLINRIQAEILKNGVDVKKLPAELMKLREYAIEEKLPTVARVLRMTSEHIEENESFLIPVPGDEPVDEVDGEPAEETNDEFDEATDPVESLNYMLTLISQANIKANHDEIVEYRNALINF